MTIIPVPRTLDETVDPRRTALLVYDMQVGIFEQAPALRDVIPTVVEVLATARESGMPVVFCRHMSLPVELMGAQALRTAMAWQRSERAEQVRSLFLRGSPGFELVPEATPQENEVVFDKLGMSMFAGTPVDTTLRDLGVTSFAIVGVVLEIGIAPTVCHATDLGYVPIVVADACGSVDEAARGRALETMDHSLMALTTDSATICRLLSPTEGHSADTATGR